MKNNPSAFSETSLGSGLAIVRFNDSILQTKIRRRRAPDGAVAVRHRHQASGHIEFYIYSPNALAASAVLDSNGFIRASRVRSASSTDRRAFNEVRRARMRTDGASSRTAMCGTTVRSWHASPSWTLNDYIGITSRPGSPSSSYRLRKTERCIGSVDLPSLKAPARSSTTTRRAVSGNPGDLAVWANAGQTPQRYPGIPRLVVGSISRTGLVPLYLATEPYICASDDETPNQKYEGDLDRAQSPPNDQSRGEVLAVGRERAFAASARRADPAYHPRSRMATTMNLTSLDIRDQLVTISTVYQGDAALHRHAGSRSRSSIAASNRPIRRKLLFCTTSLPCCNRSSCVRCSRRMPILPVAGKPWPLSIWHLPHLRPAVL
jgi:hypothetical protein